METDDLIRRLGLQPDPEGGHFIETDRAAGQRPQAVVPTRAWQAARTLGSWTLVGCTVSPTFEFAGSR